MHLSKLVLLAATLAALSSGPSSADESAARAAPAGIFPADSLAQCIHGLLAAPAAGQTRPSLTLANAPAVRAFYARRAFSAVWCEATGTSAKGRAAVAILAQAADYGLAPSRYHVPFLKALADSLPYPAGTANRVARQAQFDVLLTDGLVQFALHLRRGQLHAFAPSPLEKAGTPFEPAAWVAHAWAAPDFAAALLRCQPRQREYRALQLALARWRRQPAGRNPLARKQRAQQMALTLERWRWGAIPESEYLLVNLPAYTLEVVRGGRVRRSQRIIIGRPGRPTPTLNSRITSFTLAPEWRVPRSVAVRHILPYLKANARYSPDQDFLANNNYRLFDAKGEPVNPATVNWEAVTTENFHYEIRQSAGCGNLLGNIVFRFPNPYGLYLNDAPEPRRFANTYRALERGCVSLERPMHLAAYLLGPDSTRATLPTEAQCEANPQPRTFFLKRPLPLHVRYATCAVVAGRLRFYPDVYGQDATLRRQLQQVPADTQKNTQASRPHPTGPPAHGLTNATPAAQRR